jgi:hypothetical protein
MRRLYLTLPGGGFLSLILAIFIRLWAMDHGHLFLAKLATIYIFALLIPFFVALLSLIIFGLIFIFFIILGKRRAGRRQPKEEIIEAEWKES